MAVCVDQIDKYLSRQYDPDFKNGVEVEWNDGVYICTGKIISESRGVLGQNTYGHYSIAVDMDPISNYHKACHTASEMHHQTVERSITLHLLRLRAST